MARTSQRTNLPDQDNREENRRGRPSASPPRDAPPWRPGFGAALAAPATRPSFAQGSPIRVGVLHSLSGTTAISETALRDAVLMMVEWINAHGGLLGRRVEPAVVDPAPNWPLLAEKARELLQVTKVGAMFGCWTSVTRKSVLPVFEELNGLPLYLGR